MIDHHATEMELIDRARLRAESVFARNSPGAPLSLAPPPRSDGKPPPRPRDSTVRALG